MIDTDIPTDEDTARVLAIVAASLHADDARLVDLVTGSVRVPLDWPERGISGDAGDTIMALASLAAWGLEQAAEAAGRTAAELLAELTHTGTRRGWQLRGGIDA